MNDEVIPLHLAVENGKLATVEFLALESKDINLWTLCGISELDLGAIKGH